MSIKVKEWLKRLGIETTHEDRLEIDRAIESMTGMPCDEAVGILTEQQFMDLVNGIKRKKGKPVKILAEALA